MQERTLSQEIVKQCMIQERYNALWGYDTEKGIEKTEKKLLEELGIQVSVLESEYQKTVTI